MSASKPNSGEKKATPLDIVQFSDEDYLKLCHRSQCCGKRCLWKGMEGVQEMKELITNCRQQSLGKGKREKDAMFLGFLNSK